MKEKIAHLFPEFVEEKDWNGLLPRELSLNIVDEVVPVKVFFFPFFLFALAKDRISPFFFLNPLFSF